MIFKLEELLKADKEVTLFEGGTNDAGEGYLTLEYQGKEFLIQVKEEKEYNV